MNEPQENDRRAPLRKLSRRAFLPALIVGVAGLNTLIIRFFIPKAAPLPDTSKSPRFPTHKMVLTPLDLSPGFYLNPASGVIHYLSGGPTPQLKKKENKGLTPVDPTKAQVDAANPRHAKPRVNLSRSSYFIHTVALARELGVRYKPETV